MSIQPQAIKHMTEDEREGYYWELAQEVGDNRLFTKGERKHLPEVMMPDELLLWMASGVLQSTGVEGKTGGHVLIALTDRRILILDKRLFAGTQTIAIDLDKINSITGDTGFFLGSFKIQDGGHERKVGRVPNETVTPFVQRVQKAIEDRKIAQRRPHVGGTDRVSQLERLADLWERRMLTDDEYEREKANLLRQD